MSAIKMGVIGCGVMGNRHVQVGVESELIDVVAVADVREDAVKALAEKYSVARTYASGDALLDDDAIEAVVLAMPACHRFDLAMKAFSTGKHVLTEKPVAVNADEVKRMIEARGDLVAACCSSRFRFLESAEAVTKFIATGVLGDLRLLHCRALVAAGPPPPTPRPAWRLIRSLNGGGIMANWGCYDLDYLLGITGWALKPKTVFAQMWTIPPQFASHVAPGSDAETYLAALVRCEGGTVISIERGEYMPAHAEDAWQIIGTNGSLTLRMKAEKNKKIIHDDTTTEQGVVSNVIWEGDESHSAVSLGPTHDFAAAILENRQPKTNFENALVVQQITDAIYASAEQGGAVEIQ